MPAWRMPCSAMSFIASCWGTCCANSRRHTWRLRQAGRRARPSRWQAATSRPDRINLRGFYTFFARKVRFSSPFLRRNFYPSPIVLFINSTLESTMSIFSVLAFTGIKASRHGHAMAFVGEHPAAFGHATTRFELIKVVVASKDALQARKALLDCSETTIVRCMPKHKEDKV